MRKGVADGVIIDQLHEFNVTSECYYKQQVVGKDEIGEITHGITFVQVFINFRLAIL
jgi:hypothetical protein